MEEIDFDISKLDIYSGFYTDEKKLKESASGGVASVLSEAVLKESGYVVGVSYTNDFGGAEFRIIENEKELHYLKGSKYVESNKTIIYNNETCSVYAAVKSLLETGKRVLFFGLGCDVAGMLSYLSKRGTDATQLYTVELLCMGPTYSSIAKSYVVMMEEKYHSKIINLNVRYKKKGWTPPYIHIEFENGRTYEKPFQDTDYGYAFQIYTRKPCFNCKFKGENHKADLAIGDFRGLKKDDSKYNKNGVSIIIVQSENGKELINMIDRNTFCVEKADTKISIMNNPMYYTTNTRGSNWDKFDSLYREKGLHSAVIGSQGILKYILWRSHIKNFLKPIIPLFLKRKLKMFLSHR